MASTLIIFDADTTADLRDAAGDLHLLWGKWAPNAAARREGFMGVQSPYAEVVETFQIKIDGADTDDALATNLQKIVDLLNQSEEWLDDDPVNVVRIAYQPSGSTLASPVEAVITGYAGTNGPVQLPSDFDRLSDALPYVFPTGITFKRRGLWLGPVETPSAATKVDNPVVREVTFAGGNHNTRSPVDIAITGFSDTNSQSIKSGIILIQNDADKILIKDTTGDMVNGPEGYSQVADATAKATGGNVLRFTPGGAGPLAFFDSETIDLTAETFGGDHERVAVFASVRVNTSGVTFQMRAQALQYGSRLFQGPLVKLPYADYSQPKWISLGYLYLRGGIHDIYLSAAVDTLTGSPTMDIDTIAFLVDDSNAYVIETEATTSVQSITTSNDVDFIIHQNALTEKRPFLGLEELGAGNLAPGGYDGDIAVYMNGSKAATAWLSTHVSYWRTVNYSTFAILTIGMKASRRKGYITPV